MKIKNLLLIIVLLVCIGNLVLNFNNPFKSEKIGFVRSYDLIYKYVGTKEIQNKFNEKQIIWQANIDTLKFDYEQSLIRYKNDLGSMSESEQKNFQQELYFKEQKIQQYTESINQQSLEEEQEMMQGVLNQVNSFVQEYGKQNGFKIILATTSDGNILYGDDAIDLTDLLLNELNKQYVSY